MPKQVLSVGRFLWPAGRGIFPIFLAPVGRCVKEAVGVGQAFGTAGIGRVGVENVAAGIVTGLEEDTQAVLLTLAPRLAAIVIFDGRNALVHRHFEIIVEVAAKGGIPRTIPAL